MSLKRIRLLILSSPQMANILYGTSYYTGVSNIFRISLETRQADIISNAETGFLQAFTALC